MSGVYAGSPRDTVISVREITLVLRAGCPSIGNNYYRVIQGDPVVVFPIGLINHQSKKKNILICIS